MLRPTASTTLRHSASRLLIGLYMLVCSSSVAAQDAVIATPGALNVPIVAGSTVPTLPVLGQTAVGLGSMGSMTAHVGIDYIRMLSHALTTVVVELPDTTVPVSAIVRIPIVVRQDLQDSARARAQRVDVHFEYLCEVIDLLGVSERQGADGWCHSSLSIQLTDKSIDTIWVDGVSKLCSVTSTPLTGAFARGYAHRGRVDVLFSNGELRQDGHCVTDGSTRLVFANVGIVASPFPASSYLDVTLNGLAEHQGTLRVLDLGGNEVQRRQIRSTTSGNATERFDISQIASGTYTLHYVHARGVSSTTVLVYR